MTAGTFPMIVEMKRLLKHSAVYGLGNILSKLVGFLLIPVYTRCLSPADYGIIELLDLTLSFIALFVGMGLSSAVLRFYFDTKDSEERNCIVSTAILALSGLSVLVVLISVLMDQQISLLLFRTRAHTIYFDLMIIAFFFSTLIEIPMVLLRAQERSMIFTAVTLLKLVMALSLNIYFIVIAGWGVMGFLVSSLTTSVVISLILVVATLSRARIRFSFAHFKNMARFGLPLVPSALGMFWINFGDRFFLKHCYSDWEVGIYSLGYKFAMMLSFLIGQPFFLIWSTRMYEVIEMKEGERIYARFGTYLAAAVVFAGLGLSLVIPDVMRIVPSREFLTAHEVVPLIVLAYVFRELSDFFRGILFIEKRTTRVGMIVCVTTGVGTLLYFILIPWLSLKGAALATLFTFLFMAAAMLYVAQRVRSLPYEYGRLAMLLFSAIGLYLAFRGVKLENPYVGLILKSGAALLYFPLLFGLGFFSPREKAKIQGFIRNLLRGASRNLPFRRE